MSFSIPDRWAALAAQYPEQTVGRVTLQEKGMYRIRTAMGEQNALVSGKFQYDAQSASDYPAVGDYVTAGCAGGDTAIIDQVLPRKSLFVRKAAGTSKAEQVVAANIDTVFLCMSLNNDFNLRRLERYLAVTWESGAEPVVVLTKADLCGDLRHKQAEVEAIAAGVDILTTSALELDGYRQILPYITGGRTVAFVGSSGVGKSTLINRLLGEDRLATDGLRNDDKGHHTTTHRELLVLPNGAMVIDTPGMRELGMWDTASGVEQTFGDIEALTAGCRFRNCSHSGEPGCAVRAAIRSGDLDESRWRSYQKLKNENSYAAGSESYRGMEIPADALEQKRMLRSLMNIRRPQAIDAEFLTVQDEYLRQEIEAAGVTRLADLEPICGDFYLWQGDITRLQCGAIVNAANSGMTGCYVPCHACIDNCIHTFAGIQLRLDCAELMERQGHEEPTGQAKITKAYNLPCDYVLHTVGPIIEGRVTPEDERLLASCYRSCLELAGQNGVESIAFCCISTGVFHFPNQRAAEIAVATVQKFKAETGSEMKVIFNVFKDLDLEIYGRLLTKD